MTSSSEKHSLFSYMGGHFYQEKSKSFRQFVCVAFYVQSFMVAQKCEIGISEFLAKIRFSAPTTNKILRNHYTESHSLMFGKMKVVGEMKVVGIVKVRNCVFTGKVNPIESGICRYERSEVKERRLV